MRSPGKGRKQGEFGAGHAFPHSLASSCRTISTRTILQLRVSSVCNRRCSWITRASRARRYVLSSVIYALQPLPIREPWKGCMVDECQSHISSKVRLCSRCLAIRFRRCNYRHWQSAHYPGETRARCQSAAGSCTRAASTITGVGGLHAERMAMHWPGDGGTGAGSV